MAMMMYTTLITVINMILITALLIVYIRNYRQLKAPFSLGLLIFAAIFLIQKLASIYVFLILMVEVDHITGQSFLILEILQLLAFSSLTWITYR